MEKEPIDYASQRLPNAENSANDERKEAHATVAIGIAFLILIILAFLVFMLIQFAVFASGSKG